MSAVTILAMADMCSALFILFLQQYAGYIPIGYVVGMLMTFGIRCLTSVNTNAH